MSTCSDAFQSKTMIAFDECTHKGTKRGGLFILSPVHSAGAGGVSETGGVWERGGGGVTVGLMGDKLCLRSIVPDTCSVCRLCADPCLFCYAD